MQEVGSLLHANNLHILAISESHLDQSFDDTEIAIQGYNIYRKDRNHFGGGVAIFIQNHIPVKQREDFMMKDTEALWIQVHLPNLKPILIGCCYRPPHANSLYLNKLCEMLDKVSDRNNEMYLLGDFNIDWLSSTCSLKKKLKDICYACNLSQLVYHPTRIHTNKTGNSSSTCS